MALNDYADRDLDAVERPERPIPSGRVSPGPGTRAGRRVGPRPVSVSAGVAGAPVRSRGRPLPAGGHGLGVRLRTEVHSGRSGGHGRWLVGSTSRWGPVWTGAGAAAFVVRARAHLQPWTALSRHEVHGGPRGPCRSRPLAGSHRGRCGQHVVPGAKHRVRHRIAGAAASRRPIWRRTAGAQATAESANPLPATSAAAVPAPASLGLLPFAGRRSPRPPGSLVAALSLVVGHPLARRLARKVSART